MKKLALAGNLRASDDCAPLGCVVLENLQIRSRHRSGGLDEDSDLLTLPQHPDAQHQEQKQADGTSYGVSSSVSHTLPTTRFPCNSVCKESRCGAENPIGRVSNRCSDFV